jgi:hypothetical protein
MHFQRRFLKIYRGQILHTYHQHSYPSHHHQKLLGTHSTLSIFATPSSAYLQK